MSEIGSSGAGKFPGVMMDLTKLASDKSSTKLDGMKFLLSQTKLSPLVQLGNFAKARMNYNQNPNLKTFFTMLHEGASFNPTYSFLSNGTQVMGNSVKYCMDNPEQFKAHLKSEHKLATMGAVDPITETGIDHLD